MLEELNSASEQLCAALERYLHVCSSIQSLCLQGITPHSILPDYAQRVDREVGLVESYDMTMQKAKFAIKSTRNYAFSIAPINCLPSEILTRIFHMARDANPCRVDYLALVCSRWRSVALGSPSLWSHVDYHPHWEKWFYPELFERAQLHISRSGEMPLDFHLSASSEFYNNNCYGYPVERLCELVAPRMRTLSLDLDSFIRERPNEGADYVISTLFSECTPGIFTKLVVMADYFGFLTTAPDGRPSDFTLKVSLEHEELDIIFSPITVLHLTGLFLRWTSHAYRGLVDLRLYSVYTGRNSDNAIPEAQLVQILKASPGLRTFHYELHTTHRMEGRNAASRVRLADLEVVQVRFPENGRFIQIEHFLRLLEPGPKPLQLSIRHIASKYDLKLTTPETTAFFTRSNVTKLYASELPRLPDLFPSLPHLKVLVLSCQSHLLQPNSPTRWNQCTYPQLDMCFLINCSLPLDEFLALTRRCRPRTLTLFHNKFHRNGPSEEVEMEIVEKELSAICPDVRIAQTYPSLAEHQDLLDDD